MDNDLICGILIAWIETEGSITVHIRKNNLYPAIQIAQKTLQPLEKIRMVIGEFGELYRAGKNHILRFRTKKDLGKLIKLLNSVPKTFWFTTKLDKYEALLELLHWKKTRTNKHLRYTEDEVKILNSLAYRISPNITKKIFYKQPLQPRWIQNKSKIFKLRNSTKTAKEISNELNITPTTLYKWYHKLGIIK